MATDLSEDVQFFIRFLREQHLDWIADQLVHVIQEGHSDTKKVRKLNREGVTTRPFDPQEQEAIILDFLEAYFVTLPQLLPSAEAALNDALRTNSSERKQQSVHIAIRDLEEDKEFVSFRDNDADVGELHKLIKSARERLDRRV